MNTHVNAAAEAATKLDFDNVARAMALLQALDNDQRRQIMQILGRTQSMNVTDLYIRLRAEQSVVSTQLSILREVGLVSSRKEGRMVFYSLNKDRLHNATDRLNSFLEPGEPVQIEESMEAAVF